MISNSNSIINSGDPTLGDLDAVQQNWKWVPASGIAFVSLGTMAFGYSVLVTLASVFLLGWTLVFGGIFQAIHAFKVSQWIRVTRHHEICLARATSRSWTIRQRTS